MQPEYSIVRQDRFIEATRDSGYKGTESALSELIDNSIQAGATRVAIKLIAVDEEVSGSGRPKIPRVVEVAIGDNGRGMDAELLRRSLRFGDSNRFNDRSGLGRFGMGLPNASVSQCECVEVYSWQKGQEPLWTRIDVKEVASGDMVEVPVPAEAPIPAPYGEAIDPNKGTLVVWRRCGRLDHNGKLDTLEKSLRHSLGRIFRWFLVADLELTINGIKIDPFDPLYLLPQARLTGDPLATQHGDTLKFNVQIPHQPEQTSVVEVVLSLLPENWQINGDKKELQRRHVESTTGFSIVRARREIDIIKSPYHAKHWTDTWYRAEIRFDPELDEVFGVTHTKQHASIKRGTAIFEKLREVIVANVATLKDTIIARGKKAHTARTVRAEEAVQKVVTRLKPVDELSKKTDSQAAAEVKEFVEQKSIEKSAEDRQQLEERLSKFSVIVEYEQLPGAPFYRTKAVGRSIVVILNTSHRFYERIYRRIEEESSVGKTGIDLLLMALSRSEALGGEEVQTWYDDQRHEWSQHIKAFVEQLDEPEAGGSAINVSDEQQTASLAGGSPLLKNLRQTLDDKLPTEQRRDAICSGVKQLIQARDKMDILAVELLYEVYKNEYWKDRQFNSFDEWASEEAGVEKRKALYLISIYQKFVVELGLGLEILAEVEWSKAKEAVRIIDAGNWQEMIKACKTLTYKQVQEMVKQKIDMKSEIVPESSECSERAEAGTPDTDTKRDVPLNPTAPAEKTLKNLSLPVVPDIKSFLGGSTTTNGVGVPELIRWDLGSITIGLPKNVLRAMLLLDDKIVAKSNPDKMRHVRGVRVCLIGEQSALLLGDFGVWNGARNADGITFPAAATARCIAGDFDAVLQSGVSFDAQLIQYARWHRALEIGAATGTLPKLDIRQPIFQA